MVVDCVHTESCADRRITPFYSVSVRFYTALSIGSAPCAAPAAVNAAKLARLKYLFKILSGFCYNSRAETTENPEKPNKTKRGTFEAGLRLKNGGSGGT